MSGRDNQQELVFGGEPRVDLLPPEVEQRKRVRAQRRMLGLLVVLALAIVAAGYGFAALRAASAQTGLAAAQERTVAILGEQAEYAEAARVAGLLENTKATRSAASANEVVWGVVVTGLATLLTEDCAPDGCALKDWEGTMPVPWEGNSLVPTGPLRGESVARFVFVVASHTPITATAFFEQLNDSESVADASLDQVIVNEEDGLYETTITLNLTAEALADRFPAEEVDR